MGVRVHGAVLRDDSAAEADAEGILSCPRTSARRVASGRCTRHRVDVDVKPNRGDALSIMGLAREVAAATDRRSAPRDLGGGGERPPRRAVAVDVRRPGPVHPVRRPMGSGVHGRPVAGPRPDGLLAAGQRPISNVVDASNYVMPSSATDPHVRCAAVHAGPDGRATVVVRRAAGRADRALDHVVATLSAETL